MSPLQQQAAPAADLGAGIDNFLQRYRPEAFDAAALVPLFRRVAALDTLVDRELTDTAPEGRRAHPNAVARNPPDLDYSFCDPPGAGRRSIARHLARILDRRPWCHPHRQQVGHRPAPLLLATGRVQRRGVQRGAAAAVDSRLEDQLPQPGRAIDRDEVHAPPLQHLWIGDIMYIATQQGWLYFAVLLDPPARRVVGWAMGAPNWRSTPSRWPCSTVAQGRGASLSVLTGQPHFPPPRDCATIVSDSDRESMCCGRAQGGLDSGRRRGCGRWIGAGTVP